MPWSMETIIERPPGSCVMIIRAALLADVPSIATLISIHVHRQQVHPQSAAEIRDTLDDWVVGERRGRVVACGSLRQYTPWRAEVRSLIVDDQAKGKG